MSTTESPSDNNQVQKTYKVFVGNLNFETDEDKLQSFFSSAGEVLSVIIKTRNAQSKGHGFVSFGSLEEAEKSVEDLNQKTLDDRVLKVQLARPKTSRRKKTAKKADTSTEESTGDTEAEKVTSDNKDDSESTHKPNTSIFIANLPFSMKSAGLKELFKDYKVKSTMVAKQKNRRSKGYGFVELESVEEQQRVLEEFKDVEIEGRQIHVKAATSEKKPRKEKKAVDSDNEAEKVAKKPAKKNKKNKKSARTESTGDKEHPVEESGEGEVDVEKKEVKENIDEEKKETTEETVVPDENKKEATEEEKKETVDPEEDVKVKDDESPETKPLTESKEDQSTEKVVKSLEVKEEKEDSKSS